MAGQKRVEVTVTWPVFAPLSKKWKGRGEVNKDIHNALVKAGFKGTLQKINKLTMIVGEGKQDIDNVPKNILDSLSPTSRQAKKRQNPRHIIIPSDKREVLSEISIKPGKSNQVGTNKVKLIFQGIK